MFNRLLHYIAQPNIYPPIDAELQDVREHLHGLVLNAGAGWRDISHLVSGELVNQDISWEGDARTDIQIFSPIHDIPRPDDSFDAIVCIAVLEHVVNPAECVGEMFRVLKPGGRIVASVPFMQPEHKVPTDYQRYTRDGLAQLFIDHGFAVEHLTPLHNVYTTMHWIAWEWIWLLRHKWAKMLVAPFMIPLSWAARHSTLTSDRLASGFRVVALKP
jgi:SAM-dependent methyltransferase